MSQLPRISVIGLGKLGAPMVACFGARGFEVVGVDVDEAKVEAIRELRPPVYEPGLAEMLAEGTGRITATTDTEAAVRDTDVTMIIVPTPSEDHGGFSLRFALPACEAVGRALRDKVGYHLVGMTSTVMPGSTGGPIRNALENASDKVAGEDFGLCYSPEFIALGSVIRDFLNPDFLLIGESDARAGDVLASIYERVCDTEAPVARMNFVNAEIAKLSVNTFVTTKITFANMLARLCERVPGADVDAVTSALALDSRIGAKYLKGAVAYGGPCFPRDNLALAALARDLGTPALLAEATDHANRDMVERLADLALDKLPHGGTVAILGLAYKPHTDVVEEAAGLLLARTLAERGIETVAYDPAAAENAARALGGSVRLAASADECVRAGDVVVVTTPWPEFRSIDLDVLDGNRPSVLIDCWRIYHPERLNGRVEYVALGEGADLPELELQPE